MHLEEMNHSKKYWERLSHLYPDFKEANIWLKRFGPGLFYD
jgi:predicted metal-dependent hydrolase